MALSLHQACLRCVFQSQARTRSSWSGVFRVSERLRSQWSLFLNVLWVSVQLRPQRAPVTLCFHISIIFNILMGKCWQYFARFEMRRVCKPLFTEAGVFRQNKSSTAVSAKIKVHRFISCKQGLKWTDANKENIVQAEQAHCL